MSARRGNPRPARGLTLVEVLVTLVIAGFIAAVLGQALYQLSRVERLLESGQLHKAAESLRASWVRSALESILPGEAGSDDRLRGSALELQGLSADVPQIPDPGLARLHLRITYVEATGQTQLQLVRPGGTSEPSDDEAVALLAWPGQAGRFRYLGAKGVWHDRWPVESGATEGVLPRVIAIETGLAEMPMLLAATRASAIPLPTRRQLESM